MADLPIIYGTSSALYPLEVRISFDTLVSDFRNGSQQRSVMRRPLVKLGQNISGLTLAQKDLYKSLFVNSKGQMNTGMSSLLFGTLFQNFSFDSDTFEATETKPGVYEVSFNLTQTHTQDLGPDAPGAAFPLLGNGSMGQLPYTQRIRYVTDTATVESSAKYTWGWFGSGVNNCPTRGLYSWDFDERELTDDDSHIRLAHFLANWGRKFSFSFTDEDGSIYSNCHYATDEMVMNLIEPNKLSCKTSIEETFGSPS